MMMDKGREEKKKKTGKKVKVLISGYIFKIQGNQQTPQAKEIYPNRDIPTPEPVPGRAHIDVQTEKYVEQLTDKPPEREEGVATEFYLDRPPVPLF